MEVSRQNNPAIRPSYQVGLDLISFREGLSEITRIHNPSRLLGEFVGTASLWSAGRPSGDLMRSLIGFGATYSGNGLEAAARMSGGGAEGIDVEVERSGSSLTIPGRLLGLVGAELVGDDLVFQGVALVRGRYVAVYVSTEGVVSIHPAHFTDPGRRTSPERLVEVVFPPSHRAEE